MDIHTVKLSEKTKGDFGLSGHAGVGHTHSRAGFVQDDSAGFAVVASILRDALWVDTRIKNVAGDPSMNTITVETYSGGVGTTSVRRGLTPFEIELLSRAVNEDGIYTQAIAMKVFGRIYGQGAMEPAVALQGAVALAVMDSFTRSAPDKVLVTEGEFEGKIDKMIGTVLDIDGEPVSVLLVINGTKGGIGPDEDLEGNIATGEKGLLMEKLGLKGMPTIIVESKAYMPAYSKDIIDCHFLFRAQSEVDNTIVAAALVKSAQAGNYAYIHADSIMPQVKGELANATVAVANTIIDLGNQLKNAETSMQKVQIVAHLTTIVSQDAGSVTYMSNSLHEKVRGAGMVPGTSAVISLIVPPNYLSYWKIPCVTQADVKNYRSIILGALNELPKNKVQAYNELNEKLQEIEP